MTEIYAESIWATALAHPLRVRLLRRMVHVYATVPVELAGWWQVDIRALRGHVRRLRALGLIEQTDRPEVFGRGAYRLRDRPATEEALWRLSAPLPARNLAERFEARLSTIAHAHQAAHERLRERREQLGLSQPVLARRAGIQPEMLGRIERGRVDPRLSVVLVLADELDYPPDQLFVPTPQAETCR